MSEAHWEELPEEGEREHGGIVYTAWRNKGDVGNWASHVTPIRWRGGVVGGEVTELRGARAQMSWRAFSAFKCTFEEAAAHAQLATKSRYLRAKELTDAYEQHLKELGR